MYLNEWELHFWQPRVQSDDYIIITMFTSISLYYNFGASLGGKVAGDHSFLIFFATNSLAGDLAYLLLNQSPR